MIKLLVVDDELNILKMIKDYLTLKGFEVDIFNNSQMALKAFKENEYDLVLLDIMIDELSGFDLLKKMQMIKKTKVFFISALGSDYDKIYGFDLGAYDYITKPFSLLELEARIKRIIPKKQLGDEKLLLDFNRQQVIYQQKEIFLSKNLFNLLKLFIENKGKIILRDKIIREIWGDLDDDKQETLNAHIKLLRQKLNDKNLIKTIKGVGYLYE